HLRRAAADNPTAHVLVRALRFSTGAAWHIPVPTPVAEFTWTDLSADGTTDLGRALTVLADELKTPPMPDRALPPVVVLLTDGEPTDDWQGGLDTLLQQDWGRKAIRIAVAIGRDANVEMLQQFAGSP